MTEEQLWNEILDRIPALFQGRVDLRVVTPQENSRDGHSAGVRLPRPARVQNMNRRKRKEKREGE